MIVIELKYYTLAILNINSCVCSFYETSRHVIVQLVVGKFKATVSTPTDVVKCRSARTNTTVSLVQPLFIYLIT